MEDTRYPLIVEQLARLSDNIESRFRQIETNALHEKELNGERFQAVQKDVSLQAKSLDDHEARIRAVTEAVTSLRTTGSLIQAAQAGLTLVAAAVAAWLGWR